MRRGNLGESQNKYETDQQRVGYFLHRLRGRINLSAYLMIALFSFNVNEVPSTPNWFSLHSPHNSRQQSNKNQVNNVDPRSLDIFNHSHRNNIPRQENINKGREYWITTHQYCKLSSNLLHNLRLLV
jgi:hypothetical protein